MKSWLKDKVIIVTGASSGIGKDISKILINKYNAFVIGVARREEKLKEFKNSLCEKQNNFEYVVADVSKEEDWQKIYNFAKDKNVEMLINNAGTMPPILPADKIDLQLVERVFKTNFYSSYLGYKTFCKDFRKSKNCGIINICSIASICSIPGQSIYSASKSAQASFSKIISSEEKGKIFVGTYLPGCTKTNLFYSKDNSVPVLDEKTQKLADKIFMESEKMAKKIVNAINKKKRYKKFGFDATLLKFLNSVAPNKSADLYLKLFKKLKLDCFNGLFE